MIKYAAYFVAGLATSFWALGFIYISRYQNSLYFLAWLLIPVALAVPFFLFNKLARSRAK